MSGRLTEGFRDIIDLRWSDFVEMEQSPTATNFDGIVCAVVRACAKGNLRAIQTALDRLDGKIAAEIEVEYPKFYVLYPNATTVADSPEIIDVNENSTSVAIGSEDVNEGVSSKLTPVDKPVEEELPTGSLRAVLERMLDSEKTIVANILETAKAVDDNDLSRGNPLVKSVIVAGLMKLVHDGRISAVFEVFDQIDGKVADKFKVLGNDVYMKNYSTIAPAGATLNEQGIYQLEADNTTNSWVARLEQTNRKR